MKIHWNIEQRTHDWHAIKLGFAGSSSAFKVLKYKSMDDLAFDLAAERLEPKPEYFDEGFISGDMMRGIELEPEAIEAVQQHWGIDTMEVGFVHDDLLPIGVSPDHLSIDATVAIEVKCPSGRKHLQYIQRDVLPFEYTPQVIMYFAVISSLKSLYFASYRPECPQPLWTVEVTNETLVNIGTEAKPVMSFMYMAASAIRVKAMELATDIEYISNQIKTK
jgi:hypothetical protein